MKESAIMMRLPETGSLAIWTALAITINICKMILHGYLNHGVFCFAKECKKYGKPYEIMAERMV